MATDKFSSANFLAEGGFGYVHKGVIPNGGVVASKQLKAGSCQGKRQFQAEVEIISHVRHKHLVPLVNFNSIGHKNGFQQQMDLLLNVSSIDHKNGFLQQMDLLLNFSSIGSQKRIPAANGSSVKFQQHRSQKRIPTAKNDKEILDWKKRFNIAVGTAKGLAHLHDISAGKPRIVHRDVKSANILLDENWEAKV
ncbi:hypothetical protein Pint_29789 [Pistacia integerrima]|uniref:Uncharacterized protein n=1 Tax=Pistacia integerrima TaxID=434235 RepID=A0ACC0X2D3_9ROSI|nr:hypothetical protein Pint_29789 [Pistacia integerrima]